MIWKSPLPVIWKVMTLGWRQLNGTEYAIHLSVTVCVNLTINENGRFHLACSRILKRGHSLAVIGMYLSCIAFQMVRVLKILTYYLKRDSNKWGQIK